MSGNLLCLSSGLTPRYRLDSLRALALPKFTVLQFRYSEDIVAMDLWEPLASNQLSGAVVLLAQVSTQSRLPDGAATITPLRRAILQSSRKIGGYYFLRFRLWGYATCKDVPLFQVDLPKERPTFHNEKISGLWCLRVVQHRGWEEGFDLGAFQTTARNLKAVPEFSTQKFFYAVESLNKTDGSDISPDQHGEFGIPAASQFEVRVFHFDPTDDHGQMTASAGSISVVPSVPILEAVTNGTLPIDSPYDLKTVLVRTANLLDSKTLASIVVRVEKKTDGTTELDNQQPELLLPIRVETNWGKAFGEIAVLTLLIWAQQYISASASREIGAGRTTVLGLLALLTAAFAVLAIKKRY